MSSQSEGSVIKNNYGAEKAKSRVKNYQKIEYMKMDTGLKTVNSLSLFAKNKSLNDTKKYDSLKALSPKQPKASTTSNASIADKVQPFPFLTLTSEASDIVHKKAMPVKVSTTSKHRALSKRNIKKNEAQEQADNLTPNNSHQSSCSTELPKLRAIMENITSFVKIDHEKIYPLLEIFIDYVQQLLPDRIKPQSLSNEKLRSLPEELKEKMNRFERQQTMDSLISPGIELENAVDNKNYEDKLMEHKLSDMLPILRKSNGDVNFTYKNEQTILHIFVRRYVVTHRILSEEDLSKPEYKNSSESKLRAATFHVIEALIKKGASVDIADVQGNTPLHILAKYEGYEEIMHLLLEHYTEIDICNKNGDTVLHLMIGTEQINDKRLENIITLVSKGADMHKRNDSGMATIHLAVEFCHIKVLYIFERREADFTVKTKDGQTCLHLVCKSSSRDDVGKLKIIDLSTSKGIDVNAADKGGYTAMHYAVKFSSRTIIERLINLGADTLCQTKEMSLTPLHLAAKFGCSSAINTLVRAGVDVNNATANGITPLHLAILHSDPLTAECLIVNGADVDRREAIFGFAPAHMTAFVCRKKLDLLVQNKADVNARNNMGITPLQLASMLGNVEVVEGLCRHGAEMNCRDDLFGTTALHWASMKSKRMNLNLIASGKDQSEDDAVVNEFWKPFFLKSCKDSGSHDNVDPRLPSRVLKMLKLAPSLCTVFLQPKNEAMRVLLRFGALADMQDNEGQVAVHNVLKNDNVEGMRIFLEYGLDFNRYETSRRILDTWNSVKVRSYLLWSAMKLRVAGLPVAEVYLAKVLKPQFQSYHGYWADEVDRMKRCAIDDGVSLHDVLGMTCKSRAGYVERVMSLRRRLEIDYPGYWSLILASCRQAVVRIDLEEMAKDALSRVTDVRLGDAWRERLFSYLSNVELRAFIEGSQNNM